MLEKTKMSQKKFKPGLDFHTYCSWNFYWEAQQAWTDVGVNKSGYKL